MSTTVEVSVVNAVITRLVADTTLIALVPAAQIDQIRGPTRNITVDSERYIIVSPSTNDNPKHAQRSDGFDVSFVVISVDLSRNGLHNLGPIGERIYGDANLTAANNGVPTYGLHVHRLVLGADANGWLANTIMSSGAWYDGFEDVMVRSEKFSVNVSRVPS